MKKSAKDIIEELRTKLVHQQEENQKLRKILHISKYGRPPRTDQLPDAGIALMPTDDQVEIMRRVQRGLENSLKMPPAHPPIQRKKKLIPGKFR